MAIGSPVGKIWTYAKVEDQARSKIPGAQEHPLISPSLALDVILSKSQGLQKALLDANDGHSILYETTNSGLGISGSANPYLADLSAFSPYICRVITFTHVTNAGVRRDVKLVSPTEAKDRGDMAGLYATSVWGVYEGDSFRLFGGSSFTITTSNDTIETKYYRQVIIGSITRSSYIDLPDSLGSQLVDLVAADFQMRVQVK